MKKTPPAAATVRPRGRPALAEGEASVLVATRMSPAQREKLAGLGGAAWIRERIDKARQP